MAYQLRCPVCRKAFRFDPATERMPDNCRLKECGASMGRIPDDDVISMPSIRTGKMKSFDSLYRDMETSSERRAEHAAEMAGVPVSEMSGLKITNLQDHRHEGDIAAPELEPSDVTRFMEATGIGGFQGGGVQYSGAVQQGPFPNSGARTRTALQESFTQATGGRATSERPALETVQPGYRRRG